MAHKLVDSYREKGARKKLVELLRDRGIADEKVLKAIGKVPRHYFFDETFWTQAYKDIAFPIGDGQTISQPYTVAYQTELLHIKPGDKVLEIGTGSGYQTCILLELGAKVYTIERQENLYKRTSQVLPHIGYHAEFFFGDGSKGIAEHAPYDKIIVTAGAPLVPEIMLKQLKIGGILVIPVGDENSQKMITVLRVSEKDYERISLDTFRFVPLVGEKAW
ncbi:MAG: protein-L-isoaspartate O-methyltransferase [Sphingobacteriales bacterium 17-39-43]|jgi:protein-L-isoaspartate(D-aspartate) O-methyltransferase|uniref:protein-L-isoaspartate(D-aspartate) O-methyltransferase n=1 Tax=Daejeonella sp. TaxID=2805397 RepID=UPI000BC747EC|nr:protein-L-isoaspartate(D-aspartate) O-methyltransferase [Daejeonella sp.]OYZ29507.1 MAG: protein-L-isoaspartate O-methyltransferase [Sphingobacteriales bacterium 16-39-50]OYZ57619.1 MAG: protein-L-isoaspartate O-methyltransferase [Sphingobacteriales bacterium 24-40-4]OZA22636.1 MAG: protein-L-isoaspartate O-methyltransferase [Sphingobacteriales bacterium 17-39-43]OZA54663.1 MAG: protein-L-isoaspartate O-methyltransferase [Sphingobacteriales bacterium 39-40-5]HQS05356.1 protein-L-isoaspartat